MNVHVIIGILIALGSMWLGAWGMSFFEAFKDWQHFPTFLTAMFGFFGGSLYAIFKSDLVV